MTPAPPQEPSPTPDTSSARSRRDRARPSRAAGSAAEARHSRVPAGRPPHPPRGPSSPSYPDRAPGRNGPPSSLQERLGQVRAIRDHDVDPEVDEAAEGVRFVHGPDAEEQPG